MKGITTPLLTAGLLSCSSLLSGCSFHPRDAEAPGPDQSAREEVERTAYAGTEKEKEEDRFDAPEAEPVSRTTEGAEPSEKLSEPAPREVGHATLRLGSAPPFQEGPFRKEAPAAAQLPEAPAALPSRWTLHKSLWVGEGYLHQAHFTADGSALLALSTDSGSFHHFDVATGRRIKKIALPDFEQFDGVEFAVLEELPQRAQVVVVRESGAQLLDLESGRFDELEAVPAGNGIEQSGRSGLYGTTHRKIAPQSGTLRLEWFDGQLALEAECKERPDDWALSTDGRYLTIAYYPSNVAQIVDLKSLSLHLEVPLPKWGGAVALSPDGGVLAMGGEKLVLVRTSDGSLIAEDTDYENNIDDIRFTPQGDLLLVSAYDGKARSYVLPTELDSMKELPRPQSLEHSGSANVYSLGLSRDGRYLATPSGDKTVKIWKR